MDEADIVDTQWPHVLALMPDDLETSAVAHRALLRKRQIKSAGDLLRLALLYAACDHSLKASGARADALGMARLSAVAVLKRLRKAADWLGYLVLAWLRQRGLASAGLGLSIRLVDATGVSQPGSKGTDWRVHLGLDLAHQRISHVELTDAKGGETLLRHPVRPDEVLVADRGYAQREGVAWVLDQQGHVLVRINCHNFPLETRDGQPFDILKHLETLAPGELGDWDVQFRAHNQVYPLRLVAVRKTKPAAQHEQERIRREASRKGRRPDERSLRAAHFCFAITDLETQVLPTADALELYRLRWQVEIAFKRLKGLLHLDHLRAKDPDLARAYLYSKLLAALIVDELTEGALAFFPWGYPLHRPATEPVASRRDLGRVPGVGSQGRGALGQAPQRDAESHALPV
jgi:hypothetical protein